MANPVGKKLTAAQIEEIVRLYDEGMVLRAIAAETGWDYKTVRRYVHLEEARRGKAFEKERDQRLGQLAGKLLRNLDQLDSLKLDPADVVRAKAEQRQHIAQLAKLIGLDQPQKVEHSGEVGMTFPTVLRIVEEVDATPVEDSD